MGHATGRFVVEVNAAIGAALLLVVTLIWQDWIEVVFRVDPDRGNGALEWAIVAASTVASVAFALRARRTWRHAHAAA